MQLPSPQQEDAVIHHAGNVAAVVFPFSFLWLNAPHILSIITGLLGVGWYVMLYLDRNERKQRERKNDDKDFRG